MSDPAEDYVNDLIEDAKLVASYGTRSGLLQGGELFTAIAKVEDLQGSDRKASAPDVAALQTALNSAMKIIPPATLLALKSGWTPFGSSQKSLTKRTWGLVAVSVFLVVVVAHLSITYNNGTALLKEIEASSIIDPERRLNELARQLVDARSEIAAEAAPLKVGESTEPRRDGLKWQAYFRIYDDLEQLNRRMNDLNQRVYQYSYDATYPVWGARPLMEAIYSLQAFISGGRGSGPGAEQTYGGGRYASDLETSGPARIVQTIGRWIGWLPAIDQSALSKVCSLNPGYQKTVEEQIFFIKEKMSKEQLADSVNEYLQANYYLKCFELTSKFGAPDIEFLRRLVNGLLSPYALWILPGLYGAMGALIFHLRKLVDPISPDPQASRIVHRIALGALAGMILAWFWTPETRFGTELASTGFTLFGMAFIFGFSLDIFFALLDRFVAVTEASVGKLGSTEERKG